VNDVKFSFGRVIAVSVVILVIMVGMGGIQSVASLSINQFASVINGKATKCSGLAVCSYTVGASGFASTNAGVGGYVGQSPLPFSGGSVSFLLPGEALVTYSNGVYSGTAILAEYSSTAGTVYKVTGTFASIDANSGKVVKGSTSGYVGIKGHSGRGGGNTYTLLNGTISFNPTNLDGSLTTVTCNPTSFLFGTSTKCTATVTDSANATSFPTGYVTFSSTLGFSPTKCHLSSGSCSVQIAATAGTWPVYASYSGDSLHYKTPLTYYTELYVGCPPDGC